MNTPLMKYTAAVTTALVLGLLVARSPSGQAQSAAPLQVPVQNPVPVVVNPSPKQYRVIDIGRIAVAKGQTPAGTMEAILNEMGSSGWIVVATSGSFVIMMQ
jgi:hypothetical protein